MWTKSGAAIFVFLLSFGTAPAKAGDGAKATVTASEAGTAAPPGRTVSKAAPQNAEGRAAADAAPREVQSVPSAQRAIALETYKRMAGDAGLEDFVAAADSKALLADIPRLMMDFGMAEIWARPGLPMREKSIVTISVLLATNHSAELKGHMAIGLHNGLSVEDIRDILVHCIPYVGFPPVVEAQKQLLDVIKEQGLDKKYPHQRPWPGVHE